MELLLGDLVFVSVHTAHGITGVQGAITAIGLIENKPDHYWFEVAGLTCRFYSDDKIEVSK